MVTGGTLNTSGTILGTVMVDGGDATVSITGGSTGAVSVGTVSAAGSGMMTGGSIDGLNVSGADSTFTLKGGALNGDTSVSDGGTIIVPRVSGESAFNRFGGDVVIGGDAGAGAGTLILGENVTVGGDFTNNGDVLGVKYIGSALTLDPGHVFTNNGTVGDVTGRNFEIEIAADNLILGQSSVVTAGVFLRGDVVNAGQQVIDERLGGDLSIIDGGTTTVDFYYEDQVNDGGHNISTGADTGDGQGTLIIEGDSYWLNLANLENNGRTIIREGSYLSFDTVQNSGELMIDGSLEVSSDLVRNDGTIALGAASDTRLRGALENADTGVISLAAGAKLIVNQSTAFKELADFAFTNAGRIEVTGSGAVARIISGAARRSGTGTVYDRSTEILDNLSTGEILVGATSQLVAEDHNLKNAGVLQIDEQATGQFGWLENQSGGEIVLGDGASLWVEQAALVNSAGSVLTNNGGTIDAYRVNTDPLVDRVVNAAGAQLVNNGGTIAGMLNNAGEVASSGTIAALKNSDGLVQNSGTISGTTEISGGVVQNTGTMAGHVTIQGGQLQSQGTLLSGLAASASSAVWLSGQVDGLIATSDAAELTIDADLTANAGLNHDSTGLLQITGSDTTVTMTGLIDNSADFLLSDATLEGDTGFDNTGSLSLVNAFLNMDVTNAGSVAVTDSALAGDVLNSGQMYFFGNNSLTGTLSASDTGSAATLISLQNGSTADHLSITGDLVLGDQLALDVDLSDGAGRVDTISVTGDVTQGASGLTFAFNNIGTDFVKLDGDVDVLSYGGTLTLGDYAVTGLPVSGAIQYKLADNPTAKALQLSNAANPAIGGMVGSVAAVQSILGPILDRPASQVFHSTAPDDTSGAAFAGGPRGGCGPDTWVRMNGGRATGTSKITNDFGSYESKSEIKFHGMQAGVARSCDDAPAFGDLSLSFGAALGVDGGVITQPVFALDPLSGKVLPGAATSRNKQDFERLSGAVLLGITRDSAFAEFQIGYEQTTFDLKNIAADPSLGLGVADQTYKARAVSLRGTFGNTYMLNRESGLSLRPSIGFSFSNERVGDLAFDNGTPGDNSDDGVLQIDDVHTRLGFVSLTVEKETARPGSNRSMRIFGTATAYHDFGPPIRSRYYGQLDSDGNPDTSSDPDVSESSNMGTYGEVGLGVNFGRSLTPGRAGAERMLQTTLRADTQFSDHLDGWALSAEVRFQF